MPNYGIIAIYGEMPERLERTGLETGVGATLPGFKSPLSPLFKRQLDCSTTLVHLVCHLISRYIVLVYALDLFLTIIIF
ncbi:hypothetical protein CHE29_15760 [Salmonella enterica]|nr:hypothetical protein CHE29_15760 [Salmonella enterica]